MLTANVRKVTRAVVLLGTESLVTAYLAAQNTYCAAPPAPTSRRYLIVDTAKWVPAATKPVSTMSLARSSGLNMEAPIWARLLTDDKSVKSISEDLKEVLWTIQTHQVITSDGRRCGLRSSNDNVST